MLRHKLMVGAMKQDQILEKLSLTTGGQHMLSEDHRKKDSRRRGCAHNRQQMSTDSTPSSLSWQYFPTVTQSRERRTLGSMDCHPRGKRDHVVFGYSR